MNQKKILGVLAGDRMPMSILVKWIESADLVIAADAGMLRVLEAGFVPDIVIGDFDSIPIELVSANMKSVIDKTQETTDCGKLLDYIENKGFGSVSLVCAEGDLSDHFIDTVHCAVRSNLCVQIGLERGIAYILKGPIAKSLPAVPGNRVSLLPLEAVTNASLSGVQWEFEGRDLSVRGFTSISNSATNSSVNVSFDEGSAYLFIESNDPEWDSLGLGPA